MTDGSGGGPPSRGGEASVRRAETDAERDAALAVRRRVFVEEQGVPVERELDGRDDEATHFVASGGGADAPRAVGAARLREYDAGAAKVERVAVLPERRGEGLGRQLMAAVEAHAAAAGYERVVLHAQIPVVEFYERLGYEAVGETFEDAGITHRRMEKALDVAPER